MILATAGHDVVVLVITFFAAALVLAFIILFLWIR